MHAPTAAASKPRRLLPGAALVATAALALTACGSSGDQPAASVSASSSATAGVPLDQPFTKPDLVLTDTQGKPFDLRKQTAGKPTLLYFGYSHCPDVCPLMMSDIGAAKKKLSAADQARLKVVFVTTDPARDTPQRLGPWLNAQGAGFIGLTGNFDAIQAGAKSVGVAVDKPVKEKDGSYTVTHGAELLAFSPKDDKAHYLYINNPGADQFAADFPELIKGQTP